jgi:hypothetical protein
MKTSHATSTPSLLSRYRHKLDRQRADAQLITRHVEAVRLQHGSALARRGLSELTYIHGLAGPADARHGKLATTLAGELAELRHDERLNAKKPAEDSEFDYARRLVLLKIADRVLCGS